MPSVIDVKRWIGDTEDAIEHLTSEIEPLMRERSRLEDQLRILRELMASLCDESAPADSVRSPATLTFADSSQGRLVPELTRERVQRQVREILSEYDRPMHISDIHAEFEQRCWKVPGAGEPVNITAHIGKSTDIIAVRRGVYALANEVGSSSGGFRRRRLKQ